MLVVMFGLPGAGKTYVARQLAAQVLAQTFLKRRHRERFLARFPHARFVLVAAPTELREQRLANRHHQPLQPAYARAMTSLFDHPPLGVELITNDGDAKRLEQQLRDLAAR